MEIMQLANVDALELSSGGCGGWTCGAGSC